MEHPGTLAPDATPPRRTGGGVGRFAVGAIMPSPVRHALPVALVALGLALLVSDVFAEAPVVRLAAIVLVLGASIFQANSVRVRHESNDEHGISMRLIETEEHLTTLLARLPAAVYLDRYCRRDGSFIEVVYVSPQMVELTGHPVEAFLADPDLYPRLIHPDDKAKVLGLDVEGHASGEPIEQEYRIIHADGHVIWVREEARLVPAANADTILAHGFLVDITDRKALEQQLGRLAFQDPLTGLANRALFADRLAQALARSARSGVYPAVLFLDLDEFKTVNDSLGHAAGDTLLQVVGERLHGAIRPSDCVARLGGDEFAVLLDDVTADVAIATATRLIHLLRSPIEIEGRQMTGRGSIGIAVAGKDTASPNDLLRDADAAMYRAKALRRGNWVLFQPEMHVEALARFDLEADLRTAIETDSLTVAYQPIYSFATGHPGAVEALARWDHPTRGPISPLVFIAIAEDADLIVDVGRMVLGKACRQVVAWRRDGTVADDFVLGVNVSAKQLTGELPATVAEILAESGFPAENLVIEVTESAVMHDALGAIAVLAELRETGVKVAVDDFGTGYSSLGYLQRLPIDIIKIDRAFVVGVEKPFEAALIKAVIQIADALSLRTVAEGVETEAQAEALAELGCEDGQGYLFGTPQPAETMSLVARQPRAA